MNIKYISGFTTCGGFLGDLGEISDVTSFEEKMLGNPQVRSISIYNTRSLSIYFTGYASDEKFIINPE